MIKGKHLLLASGSPRRRELLGALDTDMCVVELHDVDETYPDNMPPEEVPEYIACKKRDSYDSMALDDNDVLVTADTVVILDGKVLGKPHDRNEAMAMLKAMSGKTHTVVTGVALTTRNKSTSFSSKTRVTFDTLTEEQINYYIDRYKPMDKAGAYGIQEWIGYTGIQGIDGCYYNVMGLPLHDLYKKLLELSKC
ncbi:MAG: Maf family nucleotide pyrophosphatase [Muribaculaceae bacterium]|nr:Maf family nucleotide pyrophosphatase [Muribaculaceae bacterium]